MELFPHLITATVSATLGALGWCWWLHRRRRGVGHTRDLLQAVIDTAPNLIALKDSDGRYLLVNRAFAAFFGLQPEQVVGRRVGDLAANAESQAIRDEERRLVTDGGEVDVERRYLGVPGAAGGVRIMRSLKHAIDLPGGGRGVVVMAMDITSLKQAVEDAEAARRTAEEAAKAKSVFLATMSHEIRTPLNGVLGMCQLLMRTSLDPDQEDYARTALTSGQALLSLINDILDFTKIESEKLEIARIPVDLRRLVHEVLLLMPAKDGRLEYLVDVDPGLPRHLLGDPGRLRQVLLNLVGNAAKFTDDGHVLVRLACAGPERRRLALVVEDTGCGIDPAAVPRLFQPFVQGDSGTTRRHGGTGLGLAISQRLVKLMGGSITVTSEPGRGSRFALDLPCELPEMTGGSAFLPPRPAEGLLVVLAGPSGLGAALLRRMLVQAGLRVEELAFDANLPTALGRMAAGGLSPGVMICEGEWPGGTAELRGRIDREVGIALPVVRLLPFSCRGQDGTSSGHGCSGLVTKPVDEDALLAVLADVVGGQRGGTSRYTTPSPRGNDERLPARVLVAEDDPVSRRLAKLILDGFGADPVLVEDGQGAMEAAAAGGFDIILMDVDMPGIDGYTATGAIRALESAGARRTPIIALTANALEGDREKCLQAGMDDYLSKPVTIEGLAATLRKWIKPAG